MATARCFLMSFLILFYLIQDFLLWLESHNITFVQGQQYTQ